MNILPVSLKNRRVIQVLIVFFILTIIVFFGFKTKNPPGTSYEGTIRKDSNVEFLYDLNYEQNKETMKEQEIFAEQLAIIDAAEKFLVLDLFLFNDAYDRSTTVDYPNLSAQLTDRLIEKKQENPNLKILFITDEINNFYGVYESDSIKRLKENKIDVVLTDLEQLSDSNPMYAGVWRPLVKWVGTKGKGWLPNPFSPDSPKVNIRGYLKLLNFKANHRKVVLSEKTGIITSMNPHDASGNHSNIAFKLEGQLLTDILETELDVAEFSGYEQREDFAISTIDVASENSSVQAQLLTEGKIRDAILEEVKGTKRNDEIALAMFYIAHREIIQELIDASNRGVKLQLVLDPNKDAFGMKKNGIPNRQVAHEIQEKTGKKDIVRWYDTNGEQFHTKLLLINKENQSVIIGGSANFTRRNLDDFNLESNLRIIAEPDQPIAREVNDYFERIWSNRDGIYTSNYEKYKNESFWRTGLYRFQEWSGLSSF